MKNLKFNKINNKINKNKKNYYNNNKLRLKIIITIQVHKHKLIKKRKKRKRKKIIKINKSFLYRIVTKIMRTCNLMKILSKRHLKIWQNYLIIKCSKMLSLISVIKISFVQFIFYFFTQKQNKILNF